MCYELITIKVSKALLNLFLDLWPNKYNTKELEIILKVETENKISFS